MACIHYSVELFKATRQPDKALYKHLYTMEERRLDVDLSLPYFCLPDISLAHKSDKLYIPTVYSYPVVTCQLALASTHIYELKSAF